MMIKCKNKETHELKFFSGRTKAIDWLKDNREWYMSDSWGLKEK